MTPAFLAAFEITISSEGKTHDLTYKDKGNWTSGVIGIGDLKGSKYGISAASYPTLDIASLTLEDAQEIYLKDYWSVFRGDEMPPVVSITLFDAAINNGLTSAVEWLQKALVTTPDGIVGKETLGALAAKDPIDVAMALHQMRANFMIHLTTWDTFKVGWENRLCSLPFKVMVAVGRLPLP